MLKIHGRARDLGGGFHVSRLLPSAQRPSIGPFVFLDHFGPITIEPDMNVDVRPHPHIGLATVTYLFDGAMMHRDSLGSVQLIEPGAINLMTAGRGIVHSERTPDDLRGHRHAAHGLQLWVGLPTSAEDGDPAFCHAPADRLPAVVEQLTDVRVLLGSAFGVRSPVETASETLFLVLRLTAGQPFRLPALAAEVAVYPVDHDLLVDDEGVGARVLGILGDAPSHTLKSRGTGIVVIVGGAPLGARFLWWNFVASDKTRIERAAAAWQAQRFAGVPGESDYIPLPEHLPWPG